MRIPFFTKEQEQQQKRYSGMSRSATPLKRIAGDTADVKSIVAPEKQEPSSINTNLLKPLHPYLSIVSDDIMRLIGRDRKTMRMKQEHNDFMEHYFGGNK